MRTALFASFSGVIALLILTGLCGCSRNASEQVVLYTSQDQWLAEPILAEFERQTGIRVLALFDAEAVKTVGLANRLRAERNMPRCDLFWSNEELGLRTLVSEGVIVSNSWLTAGGRSRVMLINTNLVGPAEVPRSLRDLTEPRWKAKVAIAYPEFGTTRFHMGTLRLKWGDDLWVRWLDALGRNGIRILDGNSAVANQVANGAYAIGLTDSDDAQVQLRKNAPVVAVRIAEEMPLIFCTVGKVSGRESTPASERLQKYISSSEVITRMVAAGGLQWVQSPEPVSLPWARLLGQQESTITKIREVMKR